MTAHPSGTVLWYLLSKNVHSCYHRMKELELSHKTLLVRIDQLCVKLDQVENANLRIKRKLQSIQEDLIHLVRDIVANDLVYFLFVVVIYKSSSSPFKAINGLSLSLLWQPNRNQKNFWIFFCLPAFYFSVAFNSPAVTSLIQALDEIYAPPSYFLPRTCSVYSFLGQTIFLAP